jgi:hypothetical protein
MGRLAGLARVKRMQDLSRLIATEAVRLFKARYVANAVAR